VGASSSGSTSQIKHFAAWFDINISYTTNNASSNLGSEGVPNAIFNLVGSVFSLLPNFQLLP
jgi:hypothetical protein